MTLETLIVVETILMPSKLSLGVKLESFLLQSCTRKQDNYLFWLKWCIVYHLASPLLKHIFNLDF